MLCILINLIMSRIGKNPITIPDGVNIELKGNLINVSDKKAHNLGQCIQILKL